MELRKIKEENWVFWDVKALLQGIKERISLTENESWGREDKRKHLKNLKQKYKGNNKDWKESKRENRHTHTQK